ncbi:MarR family transcriptional regulator [Actinoalloteichus sp. AHMU CJ021]|uniref:MarR family protein n=1 Tax=Actinoalloteichus caeruleus DSM 43889 TaxID=1120930 RepID=A0ABT1JJP5_ACTCY|nr:MarR family transcriptional regulator [Actinoalloteichus caeruleus]AUS78457.1 MarR family transcriptional regulator [Actinoalloteichus sp. AHMU CJ021]MCP2332552.1 MarR family protein [Actinoalloteichus caeruleus DSM 43889]
MSERAGRAARLAELSRELGAATALLHGRLAERLGLSPTAYKCLDLVSRAPVPLSAGEIAEGVGLSTGAVTGLLDRLEEAGYVVRVPDPDDRRRVRVRLAPSPVPSGTVEALVPFTEELVAEYGDEELAVIEDYCLRMIGAVREAIDAGDERGLGAPRGGVPRRPVGRRVVSRRAALPHLRGSRAPGGQ